MQILIAFFIFLAFRKLSSSENSLTPPPETTWSWIRHDQLSGSLGHFLCNLKQHAQSIVHRVCVGKNSGHVGSNGHHHNIALESSRIFSPHAASHVVLRTHCVLKLFGLTRLRRHSHIPDRKS